MIGTLLMSLLEVNQTTGVSANLLDSEDNGVRVHHSRTPQGENIAGVVYHLITQTPQYRHQTAAIAVRDEAQVQFDIYYPSDYEAAFIAQNLRDILEGWSGTSGGNTWNVTTLDGFRDGYENELDTPKLSMDFTFRKIV